MNKQLDNLIKEKLTEIEKSRADIGSVIFETAMLQAYELGKQSRKESSVLEIGQKYWFIDSVGDYCIGIWENGRIDNKRLAIGNVYLIEQECNKAIEILKATQIVRTYIAEHFPFKADWKDKKQEKCFIKYSEKEKKLWVEITFTVKYYSPFGYLENFNNCEQLIKDCRSELELIIKS